MKRIRVEVFQPKRIERGGERNQEQHDGGGARGQIEVVATLKSVVEAQRKPK